MNMVRCMLNIKQLLRIFWVETISCAFYFLNICPSKNVYIKIPVETWSHRKLNMGHIKVFDCITYANMFDAMQKNSMMIKNEKCIFIGHSLVTNNYKLYNLQAQKIIVSCDVICDKDLDPNFLKNKRKK